MKDEGRKIEEKIGDLRRFEGLDVYVEGCLCPGGGGL